MLNKNTKIIIRSIVVFFTTGFLMFTFLHWILPQLLKLGWSFAHAYLLSYTPLVLCFFLAIFLYINEGNKLSWNNFVKRFRLNKLTKKDFLWSVGLTVFILAGYVFVLQPMGSFIEKNFLPAADYFPAGLHPNKTVIPGEMFGLKLSGQWWFAAFYFIGWFFNIAGEELLFRGFLLPKEEEVFGSKAWLFQGVIWAFWHTCWYWIVIPYLIVVTIPLVFVVSKRKKTWIGIIVHGLINLAPLLLIVKGIVS